jgi:large subunit ribosomal protein L32
MKRNREIINMPVPKKKRSRTRNKIRRASQKTGKPNVISCPQCGEPVLPHRICRSCGYYKGKSVVEIKAD